jgi:hypothetical protein
MLGLLAILTFSSTALANVFITTPNAATSWAAGQVHTIEWQEDPTNKPPLIAALGLCNFTLAVGSPMKTVRLQTIGTVDPAKQSSIPFTPDPTVGEDKFSDYFIRMESLNVRDPDQPANPALSFSGHFTLTGMTGTFNAATKAIIAGASSTTAGSTSTTSTGTGGPAFTGLRPTTSTTTVRTTASGATGSTSARASSTSASTSSSAAVPALSVHGMARALVVAVVVAVGAGLL